jgi:2-keto-4-pentenoate hydratase/2-oxohepta-3-ene-1,7-dioic acid hydratase in catechol pathway
MRLCSYRAGGVDRFGVYTDAGIIDLTQRIGDRHGSLPALVRAGAFEDAREAVAGAACDYGLDDVEYRPPMDAAVNILCVGVNYRDHRAETGRADEQDAFPTAFTKLRESLVGHNQPIVRPPESETFDFEVEYAVIIGRTAHHVSREDAMDHVAGYTIMNDGTIRAWQYERGVVQGKNFWRTGGCGPCMVTRDAALPWDETVVETRLNGEVMQHSTVDMLIHDVPGLVSYFSQLTVLHPGDMIATGTPGGVGHRRKPPVYLKPGDVLEMEISGIGVLRTPVVDEADAG